MSGGFLFQLLAAGGGADLAPHTAAEWHFVAEAARQHRLGPALHWRTAQRGVAGSVPGALRLLWEKQRKVSALRALSLLRTQRQVQDLLTQDGIPHLFLKGAYLAFHAYPEPGLRPLRDLDVLVPADRALAAWRALRDLGAIPSPGDPEAALIGRKHLPALWISGISVEIHVQLVDHAAQLPGYAAWAAAVWERAIGRGGLFYPSPTDGLLHLILHAACDHRFNNGPLLLLDMEFLLNQPIDWPLFWATATQLGQARAAALCLAVLARQGCAAPAVAVPGQVVDAAAALMLAGQTGLAAVVSRETLLARLWPSRIDLQARYGPGGWGLYPRHWRAAAARHFGGQPGPNQRGCRAALIEVDRFIRSKSTGSDIVNQRGDIGGDNRQV